MRWTIVFILLLTCQWAHAGDPWSDWDWARQITYTTLHVTDWAQTLQVVDDEMRSEKNPILGERPSRSRVNTYFTLTLVGHWMIADVLPSDYRKWWQVAWISLEAGAIRHNVRAGIKIEF